ncbi:Homeodomain-like domain-containing protein [Evansella caseinilytica]|uniref:Homeodomain-like domain-containing protein n=1 Tax=Evansella caseinilytica TaxID=1503961 RepID=A0A1H3TSG6_9BACI|nr:helix-turn-helix domain-containing protein [Evansella caseinilytica]SDZ53100.1 Homeodomain-like domain-containing protein [Evansella caseinilytica]
MPKVKYHVRLSEEERATLQDLISKGSSPARSIMRAHVLLAANENRPGTKRSETAIAKQWNVHPQTVHTIRKTYAEKDLEATIHRKKRETPPVPPKITGDVEAKIIALSCSTPPSGRSRWTLRLLAEKAIELQYVDSISHQAVGHILKKRVKASSS